MMKERPIIFNSEMVKAILEGRKTQTRRVLKDTYIHHDVINKSENPVKQYSLKCPFGQVGDRLWVRETFAMECCYSIGYYEPPFKDGRPIKHYEDDETGNYWRQPHYKATDPTPDLICEKENCRQCRDNDYGPHWQPSIHMPRWASRITLEITNIRVERLREIGRKDAIAEGIALKPDSNTGIDYTVGERFQDLWDSINKIHTWESNPWVWVIDFRRI